jgi:hypothetical protein
MIYLIKSILIICSFILILKAIIKEDFNYLYDGTLFGLFGILIKPT